MKKVLITGANSYIGVSFERYVHANHPDAFMVDTVDMTDESWVEKDFSPYDTVLHVAGIVHQRETKGNARLYEQVNRDLAVKTAMKAKAEGVGQFVFLSSVSVYGKTAGVITKETPPDPRGNYGKSKLQAEMGIGKLADERFKVLILRLPMVYGRHCKGNFPRMVALVERFPVFPRVNNRRSMIYIDHLSLFLKIAIMEGLFGIYIPQNREYMNTTEMAKWISEAKGKRVYMSFVLGLLVKIMQPFVCMAQKAFDDLLCCDVERLDEPYCSVSLEESVKNSVYKEGNACEG